MVRFCHREGLDELVVIQNSVRFPRSPAGPDVLDRGADKYDRTAVIRYGFQCELVDEAFDVKLPQHESLYRFVVTDETHIFVRFTLWILFLRWINRPIPDVNKAIIHDEGVFALGLARAGFSVYIALPFSNHGA